MATRFYCHEKRQIVGQGRADEVITSQVLEQIYAMPMDIHHLGERRITLFYE